MKITDIVWIAPAILASTGFVVTVLPIAQAIELTQISEQTWDEYSSDNTRFDGIVWSNGNCRETEDERSKTPAAISQLYTDLSKAAVGARYTMTAGYAFDESYKCGQGKYHAGIDIGAPANTTVKTVVGGKVAWVGENAIGIDATDGNHWVYVHVKNISVKPGQTVSSAQKLANINSANHLHLEVQPGNGYKQTNGAHKDLNFVLNNTMSPLQAFWNLSRTNNDRDESDNNTGTAFTAPVLSRLTITDNELNLTVTAGNLQGKTVYVQTWRPGVNGLPARLFEERQAVATGTTISFTDLDEPGPTIPGVTYYTVASLEPIPTGEAAKQRTACYSVTNGKFLCDAAQR